MHEGVIIRGIAGFYYVDIGNGSIIECKARGRFRKEGLSPIVGDRVVIELVDSNHGIVDEIKPRKSQLIRPLIANIDQAIVIFALKKPDINYTLLDKLLIQIEHNGLDAAICFNKADLDDEGIYERTAAIYEKIGYRVIKTKALDGEGIEKIKELLLEKISVLTGPSGAGKSTLFNHLQNKLKMATGEISKKVDRGKHTTRHAELIEVSKDTYVVDTPGFSSVDIGFIEPGELQYAFKEFNDYIGKCKFSSCLHNKESFCRIKEEVENGSIPVERYDAYIEILKELQENRRTR